MFKRNRYWNLDNRVAENCPPTHCSNPPKGLSKLVVTGPQEHKFTVKTVLHIQIMTINIIITMTIIIMTTIIIIRIIIIVIIIIIIKLKWNFNGSCMLMRD